MQRGTWALVGVSTVIALVAQNAHAQDTGGASVGAAASASAGTTPAAGASATGTEATPAPEATASAAPSASASAAPASSAKAETKAEPEAEADTDTDHDKVVRRFAVGYLGISQLPIGGLAGGGAGGTAAVQRDNVNAPVIGGRYWINRMIGVDAGIGFGLTGGSSEVVTGGTSVSTDSPSRWGGALHVGVPLAFAHGKHYSFEVIPEITAGITSGSMKTGTGTDIDLSGFRFDGGGRVGAEIYFGFIGVPQLSLQGSVGAYFRREVAKIKQGDNSASVGATTITTSAYSDPWALFVNNISAFYYF